MALFRMAFFRLFALIFRHFAWRISFFRLFAWRYFVFSLFRLAFFRYFVFSLGVISSWRRAITPGEKTKERNNEMAQTSHHIKLMGKKIYTFLRRIFCLSKPVIFSAFLIFHNLGLVFGLSDKASFKPISSATETSKKIEISLVASLDMILFDK